MPTLNWIGKDAVINHHKEVPFRLLKCRADLSVGDPDSGNLLVQGDNLEALKALLPYYAGQVKCIYIDPPYNTGKQTWIYNDNVNSPEIREWLGKTVGSESEDLSRHDKWLCMMYPRLVLLHEMLSDDGTLWMSIDDNEFHNALSILSEIFGTRNKVGILVWKNANDNNPTNITTEHEYVICFAKNADKLPKDWKSTTLPSKEKLIEIGNDFIENYPDKESRQTAYTKWYRENRPYIWPFQDYKFIDDGGIYTGSRSVHNPGKEGYRYDVIHPNGKPCVQPMMGYRFPQETMNRLLSERKIIFGEDETKLVELKLYVRDYRSKLSSLFELDGRVGTNEIKSIFPESKRPFDFPKPTGLIQEILSFVTNDQDIVLDSFSGSGTTGHSVLRQNSEDGLNRKFILIEMDKQIAEQITSERIKRSINGYADNEGLGGGFRYCELGATLFDPNRQIREEVKYNDLAQHVYFVETGQPLPIPPPFPKGKGAVGPLLGVSNGTAVYLLYNGILKDKSVNGGNVLTYDVLEGLPEHEGQKVIYGNGSRISKARLNDLGILFKQIPYEIREM
jgi:DNA modification methylase